MSTHSQKEVVEKFRAFGESKANQANSANSENRGNRARRSKACKQCHTLKVRCIPVDENDANSPCVRCVNSNKECEIESLNPKKRRKKVPARTEKEMMADLRAQVCALQSEIKLLRQRHGDGSVGGSTPGSAHSPFGVHSDSSSPPFMTKSDMERELGLLGGNESSLQDISDEIKVYSELRDDTLRNAAPVDAVSLGIIDMASARERLDHYRRVLYSLHSYVRIPEETTVEELIRTQPYLFNAVMAVTSVVRKNDKNFSQCLALEKHAIGAVNTEIVVNGGKSVELVKCLILLSIWYNIPEFFKARRFHILNQMAVTLLYDLGIVSRQSFTYSDETKTIRKANRSFEQIEYRVLILTLYCTTVGFCLILRRAIYVKWTAYVDECCSVLEKDADPHYKNVALFSRLTRELEKIHHTVHSPEYSATNLNPNPNTNTSTNVNPNPKLSTYTMTELNTRLSVVGNSLPKTNHLLLAYYYSIEAYLFQPSSEDLQVQTKGSNCTEGLTSRTLGMVSQCTTSCLKAMDEFNQLTQEQIAGLPLFHFTRIIYTAGILMRLRYFILSLPSHIEKDLVPRHAIIAVHNLHSRIDTICLTHPTNFLVKKMKLVLRLFVQTYVTQVRDLLAQDSNTRTLTPGLDPPKTPNTHDTSMNKLAFSLMASQGSEIGPTAKPGLHLDLLSYAATEHRKTSASQVTNDVPQNNNLFSQMSQIRASTTEPNMPFPPQHKTPANTYVRSNTPDAAGLSRGVNSVPSDFRPIAQDDVHKGHFPGVLGLRDENKDLYEIDDEFWSNLLTADSDKYLFTQDVPNASGHVLYNIFN